MSLVGRHVGKRALVRVLGPLVGVTLIVGLTAVPAWATHNITSVSPTTAPVGCEVNINGTGFTAVSAVTIDGLPAVFQAVSATLISAVVPVGASGTNVAIVVTQGAGDTDTDSTFDVGAGACPVTVTGFSPTTGVVGTSVVITGTGFAAGATVRFNQTTATGVVVNSPTQITATVPTGATTGPIRVTVGGNTARSTGNFTVTPVPAPTITSFTPTFGPVGTSVKITGTNFSGTVGGTSFTTTGVTFNNVTATFVVNSATQITATVPTTATTGPIKVTTPGGSATSTTNFTVSTLHSRSVTLSLKRHLVAKGVVSVGDAFTACVASVPVKIQRRVSGSWKNVGTTTTTATGSYSKKLKDKTGKYRAKAPKVTLNAGVDICKGAKSPARKHTH
jgi:large repetitive protein